MRCDANLRRGAAAGGAGGGERAWSLCWNYGCAAAGEEPPEQELPESRHVVSVDLSLLVGLIAAIHRSRRFILGASVVTEGWPVRVQPRLGLELPHKMNFLWVLFRDIC
jgi:hypothetical protein